MSEKKLKCGMCFGVGNWPRTCNLCMGKGWPDTVPVRGGPEERFNELHEQCNSCKGTGQVVRPCLYCDGTGDYRPGRIVQGLMSFIMAE
jgi:DnaJ-class molecular chaperone